MSEIQQLRTEMNSRLDGTNAELREIRRSLEKLIVVDGELKRTNDAVGRIGRQVDDHEGRILKIETKRLPSLESQAAVGNSKISNGERLFWLLLSVAIGVVVTMVKL